MTFVYAILVSLALSTGLFNISYVTAFFEPGFRFKTLIKTTFILITVNIAAVLTGYFAGLLLLGFVNQQAFWYAQSVLLVLAIKHIYSGVKFAKLKQLINPTQNKGLITLSVVNAINALIAGLWAGVAILSVKSIFVTIIIFAMAILAGYLYGLRKTKLRTLYPDYLSAVFYTATFVCMVMAQYL